MLKEQTIAGGQAQRLSDNPAIGARMEVHHHAPLVHDTVHEEIRYDGPMSDIASVTSSHPIHAARSLPDEHHPAQDIQPLHNIIATGAAQAHPAHAVIGPGYRIQEPQVQYILVTPDMLEQMQNGELKRPSALTSGFAPTSHTVWPGTVGHIPAPNTAPTTALPTPKNSSLPVHKQTSVEHFEHHPELETPPPADIFLPANPLARLRHKYKDYIGEFIGTMILLIFGNGVNCQAVLSDWQQGQYLSISFGWGIGVM